MAERFRELHHAAHILILPNVWDVVSARVFEDAGFPAIATSSAALSASLGYPDGEQVGKEELFAAVARISRTLTVPLSVDLESGFATSTSELAETVQRTIEAGAVGVNLEDIADHEKKTLRPLDEQVERLRVARRAADELRVPLVVNARSDASRYAPGNEADRFQELLRRERAYETAGADCLYPMGLAEREAIARFVKSVTAPVNVMARRGLPKIAELESIGVHRLSLGPGPVYATTALLRKIARELASNGSYESMLADSVTYEELNDLTRRRAR